MTETVIDIDIYIYILVGAVLFCYYSPMDFFMSILEDNMNCIILKGF